MKKRILTLAVLTLLLTSGTAFGQSGSLGGTVTDAASGTPLPGVNIYLMELSRGAATDADGWYQISNLPAGEYTVRATYVGYKQFRTKVTISGSTELNIRLNEDLIGLDEVVVTGYGSVNRKNLTASISKVDAREIEDTPVISTDALLQGQAPGVNVTSSSGEPGSGVKVRIRGTTSITADNQPLYIIDGMPLDNPNAISSFTDVDQDINVLADISPSDIESIEILKDASATAIYGARAANGVVLITTKRGSAGETRFNASYRRGYRSVDRNVGQLNGPDYARIMNEGVFNDEANGDLAGLTVEQIYAFGLASAFGLPAYGDATYPFGNPDTMQTYNWLDQIFQTGEVNTFDFSASGGDVNTRFFISGSVHDETGAIQNTGFTRLSGRANLDHEIQSIGSLKANINYTRGQRDRQFFDNDIRGPLLSAFFSNPTLPIYNADGTPNLEAVPFEHPANAAHQYLESTTTRFVGNASLEREVMPGLSLKGQLGLDRFDLKEDRFEPSFTILGAPSGAGVASATFNQTWLMETTANYTGIFSQKHTLDVLGGISFQNTDLEVTTVTASQYATDLLRTVTASADQTGTSTKTTNGLFSSFGKADYNYDDRYLLSLSARYDGSSRFGENNRFGFFPSVSGGWRISEEAFFNVGFINELKIRAGYGLTGNQNGIGNFDAVALISPGFDYTNQPGLTPDQLANPDLRWESTRQVNAGLDMSMLQDRLSVTFDVYDKYTEDLLLDVPLPASSGYATITDNVGEMSNRGYEIGINTVNVQGRAFQWTSSLNFSRNFNKVEKLFRGQPILGGYGAGTSRVIEGEPIGVFYGFKTDGLFQSQQEIDNSAQPGAALGDVRFVDTNGDGAITADDQGIIGNPHADFEGSLGNRLSYKGFEANIFLQFSYGNEIWNNTRTFYENPGYITGWNTVEDNIGRWQEAGDQTSIPRATYLDPNNNQRDSDRYVEDGSYLRLKTVTLSYNIPENMIESLRLRSLRLFATGQNLWTWTDYKGFDPEVSTFDRSNISIGVDFGTFPQTRTFEFGIDVGF